MKGLMFFLIVLFTASVFAQDQLAGMAEFRSLLLRVDFEHSSTELTPASSAALDSMVIRLQENAHLRHEVHGHSCADVEEAGGGIRFSVLRVEAVVNYLRTNGVPATNVVTIINPAQSDTTDDECVHDQRVDIMLVEMREITLPEPVEGNIAELQSEIVASTGSGSGDLDTLTAPTPLLPSLDSLALTEGKMAVAIYMAGEEPIGAQGVHSIMGGELARILSESDIYLAVDRTEAILKQLALEHIYQRSGMVDDDQIRALGQQLGVQYLCISDINSVGKRFYLDTRLVDVVTAEIIRSVTATSRLKNANEMARVGRNIALELLEADRTREQRLRRKKLFRYTAVGLDILGAGALAYGIMENSKAERLIGSEDYPDADRAATRRNAAYIVGGALLATGITIHILF